MNLTIFGLQHLVNTFNVGNLIGELFSPTKNTTRSLWNMTTIVLGVDSLLPTISPEPDKIHRYVSSEIPNLIRHLWWNRCVFALMKILKTDLPVISSNIWARLSVLNIIPATIPSLAKTLAYPITRTTVIQVKFELEYSSQNFRFFEYLPHIFKEVYLSDVD